MANYNRIKTRKISPVGTIMPWGGGSRIGETLENIPRGWIVCNQANAVLYAAEYPILAKILGNTYGPFPETSDQEIGVNYGIVNDFPYNPPTGNISHNPNIHVDVFGLPNLNQVALVDIEADRSGEHDGGNSSSLTANDLLALGDVISKNGSEGSRPDVLQEADVDITFTVEPSDNLAGRITGITMDDPIYFDTFYVIPRKLGIDHMPQHTHRPASTSEFDQFWSAAATGSPLMEFQPGLGEESGDGGGTTSVAAVGRRGAESPAHSFLPGLADVTWYDPNDGGISTPLGDAQVVIEASNNLIPNIPASSRPIEQLGAITNAYTDDNRAVAAIQTEAHTGAFPPAGKYEGRRNYYATTDIPAVYRGSDMPNSNIADMVYDPTSESQPINTAVTNTFTTTLNHNAEQWADSALRSHTHDAMELTMNRGSLSIPSTILVNNISTNTTNALSVDTALSVTMNINTPSLTMIYIIRAY